MRRDAAGVARRLLRRARHALADAGPQAYVDEGCLVESESGGTLPPDDVTYDGTAVFTVHTL